MAALAGLIVLVAAYGLWMREGTSDGGPGSPGDLLLASQAEGTSLTAVGRTSGLAAPCTAWLLDAGAPGGSDAYAVTAGRCVGISDAMDVLDRQPIIGARIEFHAFAPPTSSDRADLVPAAIEEVVWASARWTDLAVLRLGITYAELADRGVRPIRAVPVAEEGTQILVASVPVAGIPRDQRYLRGARCEVGRTTGLLEGPWLWTDVRRSDCAGILAGSQGAPAFNAAGEAMAMVGGSTIGVATQGHPCVEGRPCEVGDDVRGLAADTTYLHPVDRLDACFPGGRFALGGDCALEDPDGVVVAAPEVSVGRPGQPVTVAVDRRVSPAAPISAKQGPVGSIDCAEPEGWSAAVSVRRWDLTVTLPDDDGWVLVCVGSPRQPSAVVLESDGTAPDPGSIALLQTPVEGGMRIEPVPDPPDLVAFRWTNLPGGSADCAAVEGYQQYRGTPAVLQADDLPSTVCVIATDAAGNDSAPTGITVG